MFRWVIGDGAINQFRFSPCNQYLAVVSQDGFLRVFDFHTMDMVGYMKSYFGGLHCIRYVDTCMATSGYGEVASLFDCQL